MKKRLYFIIFLLFLTTGCTANYTIEIFDGEIKEELYVLEENMLIAEETDDMDMSFKDYAKEYGSNNKYYTNYYNMYRDEGLECTKEDDNDCKFYYGEYIEDSDKVGFKLYSTFSYSDYAEATIPSDLMPGFTTSFDGRYLTISGGSNWDFLKGYNNLETLNIVIKTNYYAESTNLNYTGNGEYKLTVTNKNSRELPEFFIKLDTTSTKRLANSNSKIVGIIMLSVIGIIILIVAIRSITKSKKNNSI